LAAPLVLAVALPHRAAAAWVDQRVAEPFVLRSEFPLAQADDLVKDLQRLSIDVAEALKIPRAEGPIDVYLFRGKSTYDQYLARNLPDVVQRRALYVKRGQRAMVLAYRNPDFAVDLRHECTHAVLHAVLPMVPLWLDEGLAKYFEAPADKRVYDSPQLARLRQNMRLSGAPSLEKLEALGKLNDMGPAEYRAAWGWVHFLLHGSPEGYDELVRYLADIRAGGLPGHLSQRLRQRSPATADRFAAHFQHWQRRPAAGAREPAGPVATVKRHSLDNP
jgi:hypothetical protein